MSEEQKHIDELFREGLGNHPVPPPAEVWASLEKRLDDAGGTAGGGGGGTPSRRWMWYVLALLLLTAITTVAIKSYRGGQSNTVLKNREPANASSTGDNTGVAATPATDINDGVRNTEDGNLDDIDNGNADDSNMGAGDDVANGTNSSNRISSRNNRNGNTARSSAESGSNNSSDNINSTSANGSNVTAATNNRNNSRNQQTTTTATGSTNANTRNNSTSGNNTTGRNTAGTNTKTANNTKENAVNAGAAFESKAVAKNNTTNNQAQTANDNTVAKTTGNQTSTAINSTGNTNKAFDPDKEGAAQRATFSNEKPAAAVNGNTSTNAAIAANKPTNSATKKAAPPKEMTQSEKAALAKKVMEKPNAKLRIEVEEDDEEDDNNYDANAAIGDEPEDKAVIAKVAPQKKAQIKKDAAGERSYLKMDNYSSAAEDAGEETAKAETKPERGGGGGGGGSAEKEDEDKQEQNKKKKKKGWEFGVKAGYETAAGTNKANKYVLSPWASYSLSEKVSVMFMPGIKYGEVKFDINGLGANSPNGFYDIKNSSFSSSFVTMPADTFNNPQAQDTVLYTYNYSQAYDSIVVNFNVTNKTLWEVELPILLNYKLGKNLSVYGGVNMLYTGSVVQVEEKRDLYSRIRSKSVQQQPITYPVNGPVPSGPAPQAYDDVFSNSGTPLDDYDAPNLRSNVNTMFRFGYMAGFSYTIKDRITIDALIQQSIVKPSQIPSDQIRKVYSQPYIRLGLGYKFGKR